MLGCRQMLLEPRQLLAKVSTRQLVPKGGRSKSIYLSLDMQAWEEPDLVQEPRDSMPAHIRCLLIKARAA